MNCRLKAIITSLVLAALGFPLGAAGADDGKPDDARVLRAGAFAMDITPTKLPARETIIIDQWPDTREVALQAIRIGQLGSPMPLALHRDIVSRKVPAAGFCGNAWTGGTGG